MEPIEVEAVEDRTRAEGGHALILVRGVSAADKVWRFRLRPIDDEGLEPSAREVLAREHIPLAVETTEQGVTLSVGPELVDNAGLIPGALIEITLPDARARGEFIWPTVAPLARPKRRHIMTRRTVIEPAQRPTASRMASRPGQEQPTAPATVVPLPPGTEPSALSVDAGGAGDPPPSPVAATPAPVPWSPVPAEEPVTLALQPLPRRRRHVTAAPADADLTTEDRASSAVSPPSISCCTRDEPAADPPSGEGTPAHAVAPNSSVGAFLPPLPVAPAAPAPPTIAAPDEPKPPAAAAVPADLPKSAATQIGRRPGYAMVAAVAAGAVALLVAGQLIALRALNLQVVKRDAATAASAGLAVPPSPAVRIEASSGPSAGGVYDVLAAGPLSPLGIAAADVSPARALQIAHIMLHGPEHSRNPAEGRYWLKRYVQATTGAEHSRIALTKLGSAYAEPAYGKPDFARARIAWELAGALGDPVAMCFLGALHELGLGVPASRAAADPWFARATAVGGHCASGKHLAGGSAAP